MDVSSLISGILFHLLEEIPPNLMVSFDRLYNSLSREHNHYGTQFTK